ncbi:MAG TPA: ABC transporter ATP-binding protein [Clostridiales bacterium]|nr:ABC transporter ATP-binding protein [Clostridiales bacterium]
MIAMTGLSKTYQMGDETICAVDHIDFQVKAGEFVSIVGPSGSGKSTLMNIIGLLDMADSGTYLLAGKDVTQLSDNEQAKIRNEKIGFVFQSFNLLPKMNALENVMVPLLYKGMGEKDAKARALEFLEKMKLTDRYQHLSCQLSGGQQQRVAIARALACSPDIILADEPTGALDSKTGTEIMELLAMLNDRGQTILLITHDLKVATKAKRVVTIGDGKLMDTGDAR